MKSPWRLPLYVALVLAGILTAIYKRDDQFGLVLGMMAIAVGFVAVYRWYQLKSNLITHEEETSESASTPVDPK